MCRGLIAKGEWSAPILRAFYNHPVLLNCGRVILKPGYDADSGLFLDLGERFPVILQTVSRDVAATAAALLHELLEDFPFDTDVDRSVALAAIMTPICRPTYSGCTPMFVFDSHTPGSGKSLLADVVSIIATGSPAARMHQSNDEEMRKRITSLLREGQRIALIDNLSRPLGGAAIDAVLTSEWWADRLLGSSESVTLPNRSIFLATGNNVQIKGDLSRRLLRCRLSPKEERPETRQGFKFKDLKAHVNANRTDLITNILMMVKGYMDSGRTQDLEPFGSFEGWSASSRNPLGFEDPVQDGICRAREGEQSSLSECLARRV